MMNAMLACCSEWGGHVTTEELIKPIAALHDSLLPAGHLAVWHSVLSGVPKRLSRLFPPQTLVAHSAACTP
jgi:hypothetical protein